MSKDKHWAIVVFVGCVKNTKDTVLDLLSQTIPTNVLVVDNGSGLEEWEEMRAFAADPISRDSWDVLSKQDWYHRIFPWRHSPPLPSLAATWNAALDFVWRSGGTEAMVCNNDIRVREWMYDMLLWAKENTKALFVSGVNAPEGYEKHVYMEQHTLDFSSHGGPDFSCYLITKAGHEKYRFDESYVPAYCEDLDLHRRYMLGGDGSRIFSVNLPYLHKDGGSGTLKSFSPERAAAFHKSVELGSRAYYMAKWGGGVNEEKFTWPFDAQPDFNKCELGCITTPQLQSHGCRGGRVD